jgi:acyl carrier protein
VTVAACDVARAEELAVLLARPELEGLRGIIHAAGVLDDGALLQLTPERLRAVLRPKAAGGWNLHTLTRGLALDFFVLCSSAAAVFGSSGQANYAAANAYLDALAHHRRGLGLPALSVNWGPFAGAGMAARTPMSGRGRGALQGMDTLELAQAGPILARLLAQGATQTAVLPTPGDRRKRGTAAAHEDAGRTRGALELEARDLGRPAIGVQLPAAALPSGLRQRLAEVQPARRAEVVLASVLEQAAVVLARDTIQGIDPRRPLREYGLDSLMALDLSAALSRLAGRKLPATLVYEQPTAEALALYLGRTLGLEAAGPPEAGDDQRRAAIAEVQNLSESDLDAFVADVLKSL